MRKLFLLAFLAACSSDPTGSSEGPSTFAATISADVATLAADATAEDVDVMAGMSGLLGNVEFVALLDPDGPPPGPGNVNGCGFGGGRFTCPINRANGLTVTRVVAFFDAGGVPQEGYDAETTATIEVDATVEGDVSRGPWSATTYRQRSLVITGLEGTETTRTVNGTGEEEISRARIGAGNSPDRSYELVGTVVWEDVVLPVRGSGQAPWPLSGTTTREYTITRETPDGPVSTTRVVVIIFDGTPTPDGTVNGEPFEFNLAQRRANRP